MWVVFKNTGLDWSTASLLASAFVHRAQLAEGAFAGAHLDEIRVIAPRAEVFVRADALPWADAVPAILYMGLGGQAMGSALASLVSKRTSAPAASQPAASTSIGPSPKGPYMEVSDLLEAQACSPCLTDPYVLAVPQMFGGQRRRKAQQCPVSCSGSVFEWPL